MLLLTVQCLLGLSDLIELKLRLALAVFVDGHPLEELVDLRVMFGTFGKD